MERGMDASSGKVTIPVIILGSLKKKSDISETYNNVMEVVNEHLLDIRYINTKSNNSPILIPSKIRV